MKQENTIRILKIEPGKAPYAKDMVNELEGIHSEVEGHFECVYLGNNCIAVVNEEGKLRDMTLNRRIGNDIIAGPFFICGDSQDGEFISLSDDQIEMLSRQFAETPEFSGDEPEAQLRVEIIGFRY